MKNISLFLITALIITVTSTNVAFAADTYTLKQQTDKTKINQKQEFKDEIKVLLNNKALKLKNQPYLKNGKVLIPFKEVLESIDKGVKWEENQQVIYTKLSTSEIYVKVGVSYGYINGSKVQLDLAPELKNNIIYVPYSIIGDVLGTEINWDSKTKALNIKYVSSYYKIGETGTYNKLKFTIESVDTKTLGMLKVIGKVSSKGDNIIIDVSDINGFSITQTMKIGEKSGDFYSMSGNISLPTCHNFQAKLITVKIINKDKKLVKIGDYKIY